MNFYLFHHHLIGSGIPYQIEGFQPIEAARASQTPGPLYYLNPMAPNRSRRSFMVNHPALLSIQEEGLSLLRLSEKENTIAPMAQDKNLTSRIPAEQELPDWLMKKINAAEVVSVNPLYSSWQELLRPQPRAPFRIHLIGLGDVGGTLLTGLRLLGEDTIKEIGIYDRDEQKLKRWEFEGNQILGTEGRAYPDVKILSPEELFECDLFAFSVAVQVPGVGQEQQDVRLVQLEANAKIISQYAQMAAEANFQGIFAVVSDPVDLLCHAALKASRSDGEKRGKRSLLPEQIRGYGLGVMHARACYYAAQQPETRAYSERGRAFGPHGADLVIANDIINYDEALSLALTEKTVKANLALRKTGFKPYIAPALSSGALSILATLRGQWHYSATYLGGVYMGARNRLHPLGTELEILPLPDALYQRLEKTYHRLEAAQ